LNNLAGDGTRFMPKTSCMIGERVASPTCPYGKCYPARTRLNTINVVIDGFTKIVWRDEPISQLWPQVLVLIVIAIVLFAIARRVARRWEYA
jgi:hypothetical protein